MSRCWQAEFKSEYLIEITRKTGRPMSYLEFLQNLTNKTLEIRWLINLILLHTYHLLAQGLVSLNKQTILKMFMIDIRNTYVNCVENILRMLNT